LSCTVQVANHRKAIGLPIAGVQTVANADVPQDQAGLAAGLITASFQLGSAPAENERRRSRRERLRPGLQVGGELGHDVRR
jgi:hypothetical protein